uniref:Uncharacterized protein n=1 Tax=Siphoviridae sp. ctqSm5 TaxID=2827949 RepID=A0A8S5SP99_9CAUD|nr:MAG TPA: hypothetical protein [Siphoviridae sp. ctqSm5]
MFNILFHFNMTNSLLRPVDFYHWSFKLGV